MLCALSVADGISVVEETVFENRLAHVRELQNKLRQANITKELTELSSSINRI